MFRIVPLGNLTRPERLRARSVQGSDRAQDPRPYAERTHVLWERRVGIARNAFSNLIKIRLHAIKGRRWMRLSDGPRGRTRGVLCRREMPR